MAVLVKRHLVHRPFRRLVEDGGRIRCSLIAAVLVLGPTCLLGLPVATAARDSSAVTVYAAPTYDAFPAVTRVKNGDLLVAFRVGRAHSGSDGRIALARSRDEGSSWSVSTIYDDPNFDDRVNLGLVELRRGTLLLPFFKRTDDSLVGSYLMTSSNGGQSWSRAKGLWAHTGAPMAVYGRPLELGNGNLLIPGYRPLSPPSSRAWELLLLESRDGGRRWFERSVIAPGNELVEATVVALTSRHLVAVARGASALFQMRSRDGGRTWGQPVRLNGFSGSVLVSPEMIRLQSGRLLLCAADRGISPGIRCRTSSNQGRTWSAGTTIYEAGHSDFGYPSSVQLPDGRIFTAFYDEHANVVARIYREPLVRG